MLLPLHDDNPLKRIRFQYITLVIIVACAAIFLYQVALPNGADREFIYGFGAIPSVIFGSQNLPVGLVHAPWPSALLTSMFLHGGWMHLIGNMLFLWVLGDNVEDAMGHKRFIIFYIACGLLAALIHAASEPSSQVPMIGASGAVSGVIGAYLMLYPKTPIKTLVFRFIVDLPAWVVLGIWIGLQLINVVTSSGGGVAWWAHVGGFFAGVILIIPMRHKDIKLFGRSVTARKATGFSLHKSRSRIPDTGKK